MYILTLEHNVYMITMFLSSALTLTGVCHGCPGLVCLAGHLGVVLETAVIQLELLAKRLAFVSIKESQQVWSLRECHTCISSHSEGS